MTYRGIIANGVVVMEGEKPSEGTIVEVTPLYDPTTPSRDVSADPAIGMWRDRVDLPDDSIEASKILRRRLMRRNDE